MKDTVNRRIESITESEDSVLTLLRQIYHVPVLIALMAFMMATRLRALSRFQTANGVTFGGNDAWYHFRETNYLLENFPSTMPFDPWTNYPTGASPDQFGTLYDQIVSGFILLTSFGDPSPEYAGLIMLIAAPVFVTPSRSFQPILLRPGLLDVALHSPGLLFWHSFRGRFCGIRSLVSTTTTQLRSSSRRWVCLASLSPSRSRNVSNRFGS